MAHKARSKPLHSFKNGLKQAVSLVDGSNNLVSRYPFEEISPDIVIKQNPRAKRLAIRIDNKKRVANLVIPPRTSMRRAYLFALERKYWIRERIAELPELISLENGASIPLLGQNTLIEVNYDQKLKTTSIFLENNKLIVSTNKEDPSSRIIRFLKNLIKEELSKRSKEKASQINKTIQRIDVKDTSSRWGSCSHDGKLSFSWRLIFASEEAIDYVVAHEVAHLEYMDHSPAFWMLCEDLSENYSAGKSWMHRNSQELNCYNA